MTTTPANLLFCASRALRDAACEYAQDSANADDAAEDKLHQAALDYAQVAKHIDAAASSIDFYEGMPEVIARVKKVTP